MNISFSELLVIVVVVLLVIKPERLPEVAKTLTRWIKWMRQTAAKLKNELQ